MKDSRKTLGMIVFVALLTALFAGSFIGAMHKPDPHDVPVGVVAPEPVVAQMRTALDAHAEGAFELTAYATEDDARDAMGNREVDAVFLPGHGANRLLTAGAAGLAGAAITTKVFTAASEATGATLTVTDVHPLSAEDPSGGSLFFYLMCLLIPSLAAALTLTIGTRLRRFGLITALTGAALVVAAVAVSIADAGTGVLPGATGQLYAVSVLASAAVVFAVAGLARLGGIAAGGLAALLFFPVGIPSSGGPIGPRYIPEWYAMIGSVLPPGATVEAIRNVVYFDGNALTRSVVVLGCWIVLGLVLLAIPKRVRTRQPSQQVEVAA